jgi:hypothetical protein
MALTPGRLITAGGTLMRTAGRTGTLSIVFMAVPLTASAHVKWFCTIVDVARPPNALARVITPFFLACFGAFVLMIFAGFFVDSWIARRWPALVSAGTRLAGAEEKLIRLAIGAFFLCLWDGNATVFWETGNAILTPDLASSAGWMSLLQFAVAVFVIWRRTCILAAAGIAALYALGVAGYGYFHMTDYMFFPGLAAYLALTSVGSPRTLRLRIPVLCASLGFSLAWTAVEKFVYPQWTAQVLVEHPNLTLGFSLPVVVVIAGFVEFSLSFFLVTGRGLLRLGAAAYMLIFISAIPEFGHLDAVGHIPIVGTLGVVCLRGASPLQDALRLSGRGAARDAGAMCVLYLASLVSLFAMYYGLQWSEYG